jgi:hypothetical protein
MALDERSIMMGIGMIGGEITETITMTRIGNGKR